MILGGTRITVRTPRPTFTMTSTPTRASVTASGVGRGQVLVRDADGNPVAGKRVRITIDPDTDDILDITVEDA